MPRTAREKAESGIYHVMLRGINKQNIFEETEDYDKALQLLSYSKDAGKIKIYGYCLMSNHRHLLLREGEEPLESTIKRFGGMYATWFNDKYQRIGHLFQDRYKSECVEDADYFLTVLRYIHYNPVKGGLVKAPEDYKYSSLSCYYGESGFIDTEKALSLMPMRFFKEYHSKGCEDICLDLPEKSVRHMTAEQATDRMRSITGCESSAEFQSLPREKKDILIAKMKSGGLSVRQISRLTGESYYLIQKVK